MNTLISSEISFSVRLGIMPYVGRLSKPYCSTFLLREPLSTEATIVTPKRSLIRWMQEKTICASRVMSTSSRSSVQELQMPQGFRSWFSPK
ncbi:hypothetical protein D3C77_520410 [compost metagenome]